MRGAGVGLASVGTGGTVTIMTIVVGVDGGAVANDATSCDGWPHATADKIRALSRQAKRQARRMPEMLRHSGEWPPRAARIRVPGAPARQSRTRRGAPGVACSSFGVQSAAAIAET